MRTLRFFLIFLTLFFVSNSFSQVEGDWRFVTTDGDGADHYLLNRPVKEDIRDADDWYSKYYPNSSNTTIKMWWKIDCKDQKKKDKIKNQEITSIKQLIEFNLIQEKSRIIEVIYYNKSGGVIYRDDDDYANWATIVPNTISDGLYAKTKSIIESIQYGDLGNRQIQNIIDVFKSKNRSKIADLMSYPYDMGILSSIKNKVEMLQRFDEVFNDAIINTIGNSQVSDWDGSRYFPFFDGYPLKHVDMYSINDTLYLYLDDENREEDFLTRLIINLDYNTDYYNKKAKEMEEREKNSLHESLSNTIKTINEYTSHVFISDKYRFRVDDYYSHLSIWDINQLWEEKPKFFLKEFTFFDWDYTGYGTSKSYATCFKSKDTLYCIQAYDDRIYVNNIHNLPFQDSSKLSEYFSVNSDNGYEGENRFHDYFGKDDIIEVRELSRDEIIEQITQAETRKQQREYVQNALQSTKEGKLSQAKALYEKALDLIYADSISNSLKELKSEINRVDILKETLVKEYVNTSNHHLAIEDTSIVEQLSSIKKKYGPVYQACIQSINQELSDEWDSLDTKYNKNLQGFQTREIWIEDDQTILDEITKFSEKVASYKVFNDKLLELISNNDKKALKILNEKDYSVIIAHFMTSPTDE